MPVNNKQKMAALRRSYDQPALWSQPAPVGGNLIQPAIDATAANNATDPNTRLPVGQAKGGGITMVSPPANYSINTSPGKPPRSPRGNQYS